MEDKERTERRHGPLLKALTVRVVEVYNTCSSDYAYSTNSNPKRTLTWPCNGVHNGGLDNAEHNYICHVGDKVTNQEANKTYEILESLGQGSFGQVLKCQVGESSVALKISKNRPAYFNQGCVEANILKRLNTSFDADDTQHIVRMLDAFVFRKHLCIAFELLDMNLLEFLKWNNYKGVAMATVQSVTRELLEALRCLSIAGLIHCDVKPENVMVCSMSPMRIKLIDFGSACTESSMLHTYIQSRFYRSPEVMLGLPYSGAIDLWSLGCIAAELSLGLPLFPGQCEYDQLRCIVKILGLPPKDMLASGSKSKRYFKRIEERPGSVDQEAVQVDSLTSGECDSSLDAFVTLDSVQASSSVTTAASSRDKEVPELHSDEVAEGGENSCLKDLPGRKNYWRLKTSEEYEHDFNKKDVRSKRSWNFTSIEEIVKDVPEANRQCFLQFLTGLFQMDPSLRWTAKQALQHSFVNDDVPFTEDFQPSGLAGYPGMGAAVTSSSGGHGQRHNIKVAASSTTGTPGSSPNVSTSVASVNSGMPGNQSIQQVPSPWHLPSPGSASDGGSGALASDGSLSLTSGGERASRFSDSDSASASAGSREGRRRREQRYWKPMMVRSEGSGPGPDFREALGLPAGPIVGDPRFGRPQDSYSVWKKARDGRRNGRRKQNGSGS